MKSFIACVLLAAFVPSKVIANGPPWGGFGGWIGDFPSCSESCSPQWDQNNCPGSNWGDCICKNATVIEQINSCVSSSSCSDDDKASTFQKVASLCAAAGTALTAAPEASFTGSALSSGPWSSGWSNGGPWSSGGPGPFGGGGWGPGGEGPDGWSSGAWTSGPWTDWWGGKGPGGCPSSDWSGWTSGTWSSGAPWTTWTACTATTTATTTFTTTNTAGAVVTATGFAVQVAEQSQGSAASALVGHSEGGNLGFLVTALAGVLVVVMVLL